ncbi:glycoside hydrolase family 73 protein [Streptococcus equi subsp. zooepidemicus]|uniref:glycoside hydrolase family 73 protein n=1 Tax=Streptococcus equi TaxID=1336 RepID=UPI0010CACB24|nr:glycoside hydrolase family 73 protein [Streptococcus equi]MCD3410867.1 glycoside hydrolase family 73 protein [Streptococcus equi subsp. zooepidemicus]MCD3453088.1 glycoside hydrolase family 73 protein [Streptococcus equi subsp. zooepidemicus]MDI6076180.1 glycoside hydrolase family 73 protein [Streptococcus equi subsp. zooepidemicus]VTS27242.1 mannosyl-glycoprotein endo-beta-N-acetylglucosaminidase family protein [Streptococcus equi subsp. zooepidemicus]HEL0648514.1 glycoside hydrolase famil
MAKKKGKLTLISLFVLVACLGVCSSIRQSENTSDVSAETVSTSSTQAFIEEIGATASVVAQERDLYASVMIAQAILESANGKSALSQAPYYNFFGIKGAYNGSSVTMTTWEDDGAGNTYYIDQAFRAYPTVADSLYDYANLLSSDIYAGARKSNTLSYQDATAALTGLYATDTSYNWKLNNIIETYGLTAYDTVNNQAQEALAAASSLTSVWNPYRKSYTDTETLAVDKAWAQRMGY